MIVTVLSFGYSVSKRIGSGQRGARVSFTTGNLIVPFFPESEASILASSLASGSFFLSPEISLTRTKRDIPKLIKKIKKRSNFVKKNFIKKLQKEN